MTKILLKSCVYITLSCFSFLNLQAQTSLTVTNTLDDNSAGSLRTVVANAVNGDTIRFAPSLISAGSATITLTQGAISFSTDSLVFIGLYNSTDTLYTSGNNASSVISCNSANLLTLDSMCIINGASSSFGGGINANGNVTISNSIISGNIAEVGGGGIFAGGNVTVTNSIISGNTEILGSGGGIIAGGNATVTNSTISGNTAASQYGGGIFAVNDITVTNSTISGNTAEYGGGIYANDSVTVTNSTISGNTASEYGGGIFANDITATNSTVSGNTSIAGGAIFANINVTVTNSTISENIGGGGISAYNNITVTNSTISENIGGSSIYTNNNVTVTNSTISENTVGIFGGTITAQSSIIANNTSGDLYNGTSNSSSIDIDGGYNIFSDNPVTGSVATDQIGITSLQLNLGPLQNNGGATFTMLPGAGSVAIGNGNPADNTVDQRGAIISGARDVGAVTTTANVLATDLINFTGQVINNQSSLLHWSTAQEDAGDITIIMRSADGSNWTEIGQQVSLFNTSSTSYYSFSDASPNTPVSYYRLKLLSNNGAIKYSTTIALKFTQSQATVYPNPIVGNNFTVDMGSTISSPVSYKIYNSVGQIMQQGFITNSIQVITIGNVAPGYYTLRLQNGQSFSLIKQ